MQIRIEPLEDPVVALVHGLDNRLSIHCAIDDYAESRLMLRMTVANTETTRH